MIPMLTETAVPFIASQTGGLTVYMNDGPVQELAFRLAVEMLASGEKLLVVDTAGYFDPGRITQSVRLAALNPAGLFEGLHILRASNCRALEETILVELESAMGRFETGRVLIPDPLIRFYDSHLSTREAAQVLGRVKSKLESLASAGAQIVVLCQRMPADLGTRTHFVASLCASADRVYFRSNM
jgi:hypothetical protein